MYKNPNNNIKTAKPRTYIHNTCYILYRCTPLYIIYAFDGLRCRYSITKGVRIKPIKMWHFFIFIPICIIIIIILSYDIIINPLRKGKYPSPGRTLVRDDNKTDIFFFIIEPTATAAAAATTDPTHHFRSARGDIKKPNDYDARLYIYLYISHVSYIVVRIVVIFLTDSAFSRCGGGGPRATGSGSVVLIKI